MLPITRSYPLPKYRKHRASGQAVVTLSGRDQYLGPYGSKTSIAEYDRLVAEWLAAGRRVPAAPEESLTVSELIVAYWRHCERHYVKHGRPTSELSASRRRSGR